MTVTNGRNPDRTARPSRRSPASPACRGRRCPASSTARRGSAATSGARSQAAIDRSSGTSPTGRPAAWSPAAATRSRVVITEPTGRAVQRSVLPAPPARRQRDARPPATSSSSCSCPDSVADEPADGRLPDRRPRRRRPPGQPPRRRSPARAGSPRRGIPVVVVGRPPAATRRRATSTSTIARAPRRAVAHLIAGGRRVIATIAGPPDMVAGHRSARRLSRRTGRCRPRRPIRASRRAADFTQEGGAAAMARLLAARPGHRRRLRRLRPHGRGRAGGPRRGRPPGPRGRRGRRLRRLARRGDHPPPLTSVRQPIEEMGQRDGPPPARARRGLRSRRPAG